MNTIPIRTASIDDLPKIIKIEKTCFKEGITEDEKTFFDRLTYFPEGFLVATERQDITGYISSEIWRVDKVINNLNFELNHNISEKHDFSGNTLYISSFAINPDYQGKGIGKILFNSLFDKITKEYDSINNSILIVSENWIPAINLYKKQGFNEILTLPTFFNPELDHNESGIVMQKYLKF